MLIYQKTHKSYRNYHIHKTIGCVHQTRPRKEQGIQLRGKIVRTVLGCIVYWSCVQTLMSNQSINQSKYF